MRFLKFSDLHAHNHSQYSETLPNGRNSRLQDCLNIIDQAIEVVDSQKIDDVFFLGDLFESRTKLDIDVLTATFEAMRRLSLKVGKGHLWMLIGNHDQYNKVGGIHSVEAFKEIAQVIDVPQIRQINDGLKTITLAFYPHSSDVAGMKKWIQDMPEVDMFLFHQGVSEAAVGPYDMHIKTEISLADLPLSKARLCIAGDFHKRQFLADGKFHYIGSPLQLSFGERNDHKCFSLVDTSDWSVASIDTNAPKFFEFPSMEAFKARESPDGIHPPTDFVRVYCRTEKEVQEVKSTFPRAQAILENAVVEVVDRSKGIDINDDKQLLQAWMVSQKATDFELLEVGMGLLGAE